MNALLVINHEKYAPYIVKNGKHKVLYICLLKAMYNTLTVPILFVQIIGKHPY